MARMQDAGVDGSRRRGSKAQIEGNLRPFLAVLLVNEGEGVGEVVGICTRRQ